MEELLKKLKMMKKIYLDSKTNFYLVANIEYGCLELSVHEISNMDAPLCKLNANGSLSHFSIVISAEEIASLFVSIKDKIYWERATELNNGIPIDNFDDSPECDYTNRKLNNMAWGKVLEMIVDRIKKSAISLLELKNKKLEDIGSMCVRDANGEEMLFINFN